MMWKQGLTETKSARRPEMTTSLETVRKFCDAFSSKDADELLEFLDDDAVYHNMPMAPVRGKLPSGRFSKCS